MAAPCPGRGAALFPERLRGRARAGVLLYCAPFLPALRDPTLKYSRIFQLTRATDQAVTLTSAAPDSNGDDTHDNVAGSFRSAFHTHSRRQFGYFDAEAETRFFHQCLSEYRDGQLDMAALGQRLAEHFRQCLEAVEQPLRVYLWFTIEQNGEDEFLYCFVFEQEEAYRLSAQLTVSLSGRIDPGRLQHALKIDFSDWRRGDSKTCLSYLAPRNQLPMTLAWKKFIGVAEGVDRAEKTDEFLEVVERYADTLPAEKEHEYRAKVVDFCLDMGRVGEPVEIGALSRHLDEEAPEAFSRFVEERVEEPVRNLYPDRQRLKRYTRFFGRDQDLSISFSTMTLGKHVIYDEASGTLTIRALPKALKAQLAQHTKKN